jgi:hypothetical protein
LESFRIFGEFLFYKQIIGNEKQTKNDLRTYFNFRLTKPKTYPSHDFKAHQLPDELDSNGGHPNYHPHNGQFTFGQTKDLNSFFKDQKKNHNLGNYKNKFGLYNSPDGGSGDIRNTIGNSFHDGRKEETFAFQVFPKLPAFNTFDHDIIDHNLIKVTKDY